MLDCLLTGSAFFLHVTILQCLLSSTMYAQNLVFGPLSQAMCSMPVCYCLVSTMMHFVLSVDCMKHPLSCMLYCPVWLAISSSCLANRLYHLLSPASCSVHGVHQHVDALCRLWSTKQEQEKVLDEEATKRKQDAADAKVRCITHHQSLLQATFISQS